MKKVTPWLVLGLVFAAGLVIGGAGTTWYFKAKVERFLKDPGPPPPERIVERLDQMLHLTEDQKPKVQAVFESHQADAEAARKSCEEKMDAVLDDIRKELGPLLTEEQRAELDTFVIRIKEHGRPGPPRPDGGPGAEGAMSNGPPPPGSGPWPGCPPCPPCDQPLPPHGQPAPGQMAPGAPNPEHAPPMPGMPGPDTPETQAPESQPPATPDAPRS